MGKKIKLFFSFISLCFLICAMSFGVYSAVSVMYTVSGSIYYDVPFDIIPDLVFSVENNTGNATLQDYTGNQDFLEIPATISVVSLGDKTYFVEGEDYTVTTIGVNALRDCINLKTIILPDTISRIEMNAFYYCTSLSDIKIPDTVSYIGQEAFGYCTSLSKIILPNSLTSLMQFTFNQCSQLSTVNIPSSVISIDAQVFNSCLNLEYINVDSKNTVYSSIDGVLFSKDGTELLNFPAGKSELYTVPDGTKILRQYSFAFSRKITSVTIPKSVVSIYEGAFYLCSNLESVTLSEGLLDIGPSSFNGTNLKEITIPHSVNSISSNAFTNCSSLQNAYFVDANSDNAKWIISNQAEDGTLIDSVQIPLDDIKNSVTMATYLSKRYNECFWENQTPDTELVIPSQFTFSVQGNEATVTGYTGSPTDIKIPNTISIVNGEYICYDGDEGDYIVTSIGSRAFNSCTTLTTVFIPRSVTSIAEDGVFAYCTSLTTINVDENNTKFRSEDGILYEGMPGNLGQLVSYPAGKTDITYSINIGHVYAYAFAGNKYLQNISFTGFLQSIGEYSFDKCANIKNIAISTSPFKISTVNIELDSTTIKDTALMAEYLTNTYCTYRWSYCGDTDIN